MQINAFSIKILITTLLFKIFLLNILNVFITELYQIQFPVKSIKDKERVGYYSTTEHSKSGEN